MGMMHPDDLMSKDFRRREFACHCGCGTDLVSPQLVAALQILRDRAGMPVVVVSGCRCPRHNRQVGGEPKSFHLAWIEEGDECHEAKAADIRIPGLTLREIYQLALEIPAFKNGGIGLYPDAIHRFIHLDVRGQAARWGKRGSKYTSIEEALRRA
jgi:uncharacterized protein YcbK (DUF882 family)